MIYLVSLVSVCVGSACVCVYVCERVPVCVSRCVTMCRVSVCVDSASVCMCQCVCHMYVCVCQPVCVPVWVCQGVYAVCVSVANYDSGLNLKQIDHQ